MHEMQEIVTENADYAKFPATTDHAAPKGWQSRKAPTDKGDLPVTGDV